MTYSGEAFVHINTINSKITNRERMDL